MTEQGVLNHVRLSCTGARCGAGRSFRFRALCAGLVLAVSLPVRARADRGRAVVGAGGAGIDSAVFDRDRAVRRREPAPAAMLFDGKLTPSSYKTPYRETWGHTHLTITRPADLASFPLNIAPPSIEWEDRVSNAWLLSMNVPGWREPLEVITRRRSWRPPADTWASIKKSGTGEWIELELFGCRLREDNTAAAETYVDRVKFRVSPYPADPVIVYRAVTPSFHGRKTPDIYYREISSFKETLFYPGEGRYCTNCHSFPDNPDLGRADIELAIAGRDHVAELRNLGLYRFATKDGKALNINTLFMGWHPEGGKIAVTGVDRILSRPLITMETQEFYGVVSDILILDSRSLEVFSLPGASEPGQMETFPAWSRDGQSIVFARAQEYVLGDSTKYDLYRVPYNDGKGGKATPVPGASKNGLSNFNPRFSPDGRWMTFNTATWASLVKPSADIWIMSTEEGAVPKPLECNSAYAMDSYHSWSSNSHWIAYASKRDDGIFARAYLTEISEDGHASPPVQLPVLEDSMMCFNIPTFLCTEFDIDAQDIKVKTNRVIRKGVANIRELK